MADEALRDLNSGTAVAPAAGDYFYLQRTSAGTRGLPTTYELMGGLEVETSRDTNANHADFNGVVGQIHLVDMSGALLTSEVVMTLPATAAVGEKVGVYITAGSTTDGEELSIRTPASDTINGTDYSAADWSRLFITGELVVFMCVVANTDWIVLHDGRIPCKATVQDTGGGTLNTTLTVFDLNTNNTIINIGSCIDTANDRITARRDANSWDCVGSTLGPTGGVDMRCDLWKNGSSFSAHYFANTTIGRAASVVAQHTNISNGDYVQFAINQSSGSSTKLTGLNGAPTLSITEVLKT